MTDELTAEGTAPPPPSLKSIAQSRILSTLEPAERAAHTEAILDSLPLSELLAVPLALFQKGVQAHAAAQHTSTLLKRFPELAGRMQAVSHEECYLVSDHRGEGGSQFSAETTYEVRLPDRSTKELAVTTSFGDFSGDVTEKWGKITITYATPEDQDASATFAFAVHSSGSGGRSNLTSQGLLDIFTSLANDLDIPIKYSAEAEKATQARTKRLAQIRDEALAAQEAHNAHKASQPKSVPWSPFAPCSECNQIRKRQKELEDAEGLVVSPTVYAVAHLQTPDTVQRDRAFGLLVKVLVPEILGEAEMSEGLPKEFEEMTGKSEDCVESLVRVAAVVGMDWDHDESS
ncbi:hypothetical protein RQP46_002170 [Phenoliferia psychrophenolica]